MEAWTASVNASGGINGHHIKLVALDDQANPATGLADAKQLVEQDHAIAIVGSYSVLEAVWAPYVTKVGIPVIGGINTNSHGPDFFFTGTTTQEQIAAQFVLASKGGATKPADFYCAESPACAAAVSVTKQAAHAAGVPVVYAASVSGSASSYTAQCLAAKEAGADALNVGEDSNTVIRVFASCAQQGYKPAPIEGSTTVSADYATQPFFQGAKFVENNFPWFDNSNPATREFQSALQKYAQGTTPGPAAAQTWAAAKVFEAAGKAGKWGDNPTYEQVKQGLYALPKRDTFGGLTPPLSFSPEQASATTSNTVNCYFVVGVENGKFTEPQGIQTSCVGPSQ
jgi:branched-chain amino acid transport system substrate-binding protein